MICAGCIYCDLHGIPFCKLMWKTNLKYVVSCEKREGEPNEQSDISRTHNSRP